MEAIRAADATALDGQSTINPLATATSTNNDRPLAIIVQDMASFGTRSGENALSWRKEGIGKPVEFFA